MSMRIVESNCTRCGICISQCHLNAITLCDDGQYRIDESICNRCKDLLDVQCARVCKPNCIIDAKTGELVKNLLPDVPRLRPDHLLYLIAIMGTGNSGRYTLRKEREIERSIIAKAYMDPRINVRIVPVFDDCCLSCPRKKQELHRKHLVEEDAKTAELLGLEFGQIINFWDAVSLARQKITSEYLKTIRKSDIFIKDFINSISPYDKMERGQPTNINNG